MIIESLQALAAGMLGIFAVMGLIAGLVALLGKIRWHS